MHYRWGKDFLEAGKLRLVGIPRDADSQEINELRAENEQLKGPNLDRGIKINTTSPILARVL